MSRVRVQESGWHEKTLAVNNIAGQPKIYYLENTLTPEQNKALYRQGIRTLLEIAEKYGNDDAPNTKGA